MKRIARVVSGHHEFGRVSGGSDFPAGQMAALCGQCVCVCVFSVCVCGPRAVRGGPAAAAAAAVAAAASWREDCSHPGSLLCPRAAVLLAPTWTFNLFNMWPRTERRTQHMSGGWGPAEQGQFVLLPFDWQELEPFKGDANWLLTVMYRTDELQTLVPKTYICTSDVH